MEIRNPRPDEAQQLAQLYLWSAEHHAGIDPDFYRVPGHDAVIDHYREVVDRGANNISTCFVTEVSGVIVGMVEVSLADQPSSHSMLRPRVVARADIVVAPEHRRQRIGTSLVGAAEKWARDHGVDTVMLDMLRANEEAMAFYLKLGYEDHGSLLLKRTLHDR